MIIFLLQPFRCSLIRKCKIKSWTDILPGILFYAYFEATAKRRRPHKPSVFYLSVFVPDQILSAAIRLIDRKQQRFLNFLHRYPDKEPIFYGSSACISICNINKNDIVVSCLMDKIRGRFSLSPAAFFHQDYRTVCIYTTVDTNTCGRTLYI